jgi:hypothetical protein
LDKYVYEDKRLIDEMKVIRKIEKMVEYGIV